MPVKMSTLTQKDIKDVSYVVGLYDDSSITTGKQNCIITASTIAKKTEIDTINNKLTNEVVHLAGNETITGDKTFTGTTTIGGTFNIANSDGGIELKPTTSTTTGGIIDFHYANSTSDYTSRIVEDASGKININGNRFYLSSNNATIDTKNINGSWFSGTSYRAQWGDLAEFYHSDEQYPKGTLIQFGGDKEIIIAKDCVNAVVTSNPGFILNDAMEDGVAIALIGRVPVRVIGKVSKFDELNLSDIPGVAEVSECGYSEMIALEDKITEEEGLVMCAVKCSFRKP